MQHDLDIWYFRYIRRARRNDKYVCQADQFLEANNDSPITVALLNSAMRFLLLSIMPLHRGAGFYVTSHFRTLGGGGRLFESLYKSRRGIWSADLDNPIPPPPSRRNVYHTNAPIKSRPDPILLLHLEGPRPMGAVSRENDAYACQPVRENGFMQPWGALIWPVSISFPVGRCGGMMNRFLCNIFLGLSSVFT
jgi:hypothetical protein